MFAYAAIFNPDTLTGYLAKFGGWVSQQALISSPAVPNAQMFDATHVDAWHGSLTVPFPNQAIQALFVSKVGAPAGHTRTYLGFSDGTVGWMINPCVPNPAACAQYRFHVGDGWVNMPIWHGGYHASVKSLRHLSVTGPLINATNYVTIEYRLNQMSGWTLFPNIFDSFTYEQSAMPIDASTVQAQFKVHLNNIVATSSPLVSAVSIGHALRPKRFMQVELAILCSDGLVRRDGIPMRIGRRQIQRLVENAVDTPGAIVCTLPDESVQELSFTDYSISQSFDELGRQWHGSLTVKAVQWDVSTTEVLDGSNERDKLFRRSAVSHGVGRHRCFPQGGRANACPGGRPARPHDRQGRCGRHHARDRLDHQRPTRPGRRARQSADERFV